MCKPSYINLSDIEEVNEDQLEIKIEAQKDEL
jgi:hypothetical protein